VNYHTGTPCVQQKMWDMVSLPQGARELPVGFPSLDGRGLRGGCFLTDCDQAPLRGQQSQYLRLCRRIFI
ncbi:MAG: hypothetical protein COW52_09635, partial [Nitrospirae bacterium CG17_big_fil_post_rev_8_21_14_2_50_50_9]